MFICLKRVTKTKQSTPTSSDQIEEQDTGSSLPFSKVKIINFGASSGAPKFAQTDPNQCDLFGGVFTTQFPVQSQIVSALHVIVHVVCVVNRICPICFNQKHFEDVKTIVGTHLKTEIVVCVSGLNSIVSFCVAKTPSIKNDPSIWTPPLRIPWTNQPVPVSVRIYVIAKNNNGGLTK